MRVLSVNAGSSSLKLSCGDRTYDTLEQAVADRPDAVGHRVVHGGQRTGAVRLDDAVLDELEALTDLAPLHQPPALAAIRACRQALPLVPQVACFDTSFHRTLPAAASTYALPARLRETVRVYGFHGLSHAWAASRAAPAARMLVAHLGSGSSLCAVLDGRSVDTTMGFTPADGLVMGTRSGTLDPGAVTWLARRGEDLEQLLQRESGLLGLAGTADMREILSRQDPEAQLAVDVWLHRAVRLVGSMVAVLGGLDVLVFTGGVGEGADTLRARLCARLTWLGVRLGPGRDAGGGDTDLTGQGSQVRVLVVRAREDLQITREVEDLLHGDGAAA